MKKSTVCLFLVMSTLSLYGCQKTPENEVVVEKNAEEFESLLQNQETEETSLASEAIYSEFTYEDSFKGSEDNISIIVDAQVKEIVGNIPVYQTKPYQVTKEDAQRWADFFFQGNVAYDTVTEKSKAEIAEYILRIKSWYNEETLQKEYGGNPETLEYARQLGKEQLAFYESKYLEAPEIVERQETKWEFYPLSHYDYDSELKEDNAESQNYYKTKSLKVEAEVDGKLVHIWATNRDEADYQRHNIQFGFDDNSCYEQGELSSSEADAIKLVQDALPRLGLNDWTIAQCVPVEIEGGISYYMIFGCKKYGNASSILLPQLSTVRGEGDYAARYYYETLEFHVSNDQICYASWEGCTEISSLENEKVATLSFEEIMERFRTQMQVQYTSSTLEGATGAAYQHEILITKIEEGMVRVKVPNKEYEYYMIPAWGFFGRINRQSFGSEGDLESLLVTINAIDGSIINTDLGY